MFWNIRLVKIMWTISQVKMSLQKSGFKGVIENYLFKASQKKLKEHKLFRGRLYLLRFKK